MENTGQKLFNLITLSLCLIVFAVLFSPNTLASSSPIRDSGAYVDSGYANVQYRDTSDGAWVTQVGYSYAVTNYFDLDISYSESDGGRPSNVDSADLNRDAYYQGVFGGVRIQHPIKDIGFLYAKGGLTHSTFEESVQSTGFNEVQYSSGTHPYIGIGAKMQSRSEKDLEFSVEFSYLELDSDYSNSAILFGARYKL
ncbi:outer membrane beta-barrel protein [Vibrio mexicanus]|uniref:outer membrane beta-barrel protein n=1 Tax=Vibrio mexicanus TaxID=1004326 RepID=UPI00063CBE24|nr:outer membrane beta-barrel protein [Vibrio mexicanus]